MAVTCCIALYALFCPITFFHIEAGCMALDPLYPFWALPYTHIHFDSIVDYTCYREWLYIALSILIQYSLVNENSHIQSSGPLQRIFVIVVIC